MEVVAHSFFFGVHVEAVVFVGGDFDGDVFDDFESIAFESDSFDGVVGHETHFLDAEEVENLRSDAIVAFVGSVSEVDVCLDGVKAFFLEFIGFDFVHESDSTAFLVEVDDGAASFFFDHAEGAVELFAAVTSARAEDVAGGAR